MCESFYYPRLFITILTSPITFACFLQDNLEWTSGFQMHFGIIWIDRASENLTRVVKNSFRYYTKVLNAFAQAIKK